jgi:long-chain acyl-CoA synthetase
MSIASKLVLSAVLAGFAFPALAQGTAAADAQAAKPAIHQAAPVSTEHKVSAASEPAKTAPAKTDAAKSTAKAEPAKAGVVKTAATPTTPATAPATKTN